MTASLSILALSVIIDFAVFIHAGLAAPTAQAEAAPQTSTAAGAAQRVDRGLAPRADEGVGEGERRWGAGPRLRWW